MSRRRCQGVTLVELVVTIAIFAIAATAVVGALSSSEVRSSDRMLEQQAAAIATAYLEEIQQKSYLDPNGGVEAARALFDDINDYNGLVDVGARDQQGAAMAGLNQYTVTVQVVGGVLPNVAAADQRMINVTVMHPSGVTVLMSGYRTRYPSP